MRRIFFSVYLPLNEKDSVRIKGNTEMDGISQRTPLYWKQCQLMSGLICRRMSSNFQYLKKNPDNSCHRFQNRRASWTSGIVIFLQVPTFFASLHRPASYKDWNSSDYLCSTPHLLVLERVPPLPAVLHPQKGQRQLTQELEPATILVDFFKNTSQTK